MSIVSNQTESLASFLAEAGAGAAKPAGVSGTDQFSASLEKALASAGERANLSVQVRPDGNQAAGLSAGTRQYIVTVSEGAEPALGMPAEPPNRADSGPWITREMWTDEMLEGELPNEVLMAVKDKADLMNARVDRLRRPTTAVVRSDEDGGRWSLNDSQLATREQAEHVRSLLGELGIEVGEIREITLGGPFGVDWGDEDRRAFTVSGRSVGLILERYAKFPKEFADQMMLDEFGVA